MKIININLSFVCKKFTFCSLTVLLYWRILINKESKWFPTNTFHNVRYINIVYTITFRNVWQKKHCLYKHVSQCTTKKHC